MKGWNEKQIATAKRIFWLAYQASSVVDLGRFQAQDDVTENDVWDNVTNSSDYPGKISPTDSIYADYVFGRMMKLSLKLKDGKVEIGSSEFRSDYQSFCRKYPDPKSLHKAATVEVTP